MATTSLWRIKGRLGGVLLYAENPDKTISEEPMEIPAGADIDALGDVIAYASREEATNVRQFVYGINCSPKTARSEMLAVKRRFEKEGGTIAYHGYQSFAEGEVTPEQAHQIGIKLATRLWGDRYQVVVATHLDKASHLHNHFIINTVSFVDGQKFHRTKEDYYHMREESDRLCLEYGLSVIEDPRGKRRNYGEWLAEQNGQPTLRGLIKADIDRAIATALTYEEFFKQLEGMGYELNLVGKTGMPLKRPGLRLVGAKNFTRFYKIGPGYDLDEIGERLLAHNRRQPPFSEEEIREARRYRRENRPKVKLHGFYALYIRYCFELGVIRRFPAAARRMTASMREDLVQFEKINEMTVFLGKYDINTMDDLNSFREVAAKEISDMESERHQLRNKVKREARAGSLAEETRSEMKAITKKINSKRHELLLADEVEGRSVRVARELEAIGVWQEIELGKEERDELFIGHGRTGRENDT